MIDWVTQERLPSPWPRSFPGNVNVGNGCGRYDKTSPRLVIGVRFRDTKQ